MGKSFCFRVSHIGCQNSTLGNSKQSNRRLKRTGLDYDFSFQGVTATELVAITSIHSGVDRITLFPALIKRVHTLNKFYVPENKQEQVNNL